MQFTDCSSRIVSFRIRFRVLVFGAACTLGMAATLAACSSGGESRSPDAGVDLAPAHDPRCVETCGLYQCPKDDSAFCLDGCDAFLLKCPTEYAAALTCRLSPEGKASYACTSSGQTYFPLPDPCMSESTRASACLNKT